jgi:hypothetical protein
VIGGAFMTMRVVVFAFATLAVVPPISAQSGSRLTSVQIQAAIAGKSFRAQTTTIAVGDPANPRAITHRSDGRYTIVEFAFRDDHSMNVQCTVYDAAGRAGPCRGTGAGTRDVGVWSIEGNNLCTQFTSMRGGQKQCFEVFREGDRLRLRHVVGPLSVIDGEALEPR